MSSIAGNADLAVFLITTSLCAMTALIVPLVGV